MSIHLRINADSQSGSDIDVKDDEEILAFEEAVCGEVFGWEDDKKEEQTQTVPQPSTPPSAFLQEAQETQDAQEAAFNDDSCLGSKNVRIYCFVTMEMTMVTRT